MINFNGTTSFLVSSGQAMSAIDNKKKKMKITINTEHTTHKHWNIIIII